MSLSDKIGLADGIFQKVKVISIIDAKKSIQELQDNIKSYKKMSKRTALRLVEKHFGKELSQNAPKGKVE